MLPGTYSLSFLDLWQTFHTPSLGDEDFEIPPISLDPDHALNIADTHFELSDGAGGASGSRSLGSNLVVQANDPSFASTFVNCGSQGLEQINLGTMGQAVGGALMSSSALVSVGPSHEILINLNVHCLNQLISYCLLVSAGTGEFWGFTLQQFFPHNN